VSVTTCHGDGEPATLFEVRGLNLSTFAITSLLGAFSYVCLGVLALAGLIGRHQLRRAHRTPGSVFANFSRRSRAPLWATATMVPVTFFMATFLAADAFWAGPEQQSSRANLSAALLGWLLLAIALIPVWPRRRKH
jgi:hypothetical protein